MIKRFIQFTVSRPVWQWALLIFLITLTVRFGSFIVLNRWEVIMRSEVEQVAISLMKTGRFADPYNFPTGLTAHVAPVYPFLLSLLFRIFGTGLGGEWADQTFSVLATASVFASLPYLSRQLFRDILPGILGGVLCAVSPAAFLVETQGKEAPLTSLLALLMVLVSIPLWRRQTFSPIEAVAYGICWAFMLLTHPGFVLVMIATLALCGLSTASAPRPLRWRFSLIVSITCLIGIAPWMVRNYAVFGKLFFLRDNLGLELALSNHDNAKAAMEDNVKAGSFRRHPWASKDEAVLVQQLGEYPYHEQRKREAFQWISSHPVAFLRLTAGRILHFWVPYSTKRYLWIPFGLLNAFAWAGLALQARTSPDLARAWAAVWIFYSLPHWLIQSDLRYYYPIFWACALYAAYTTTWILRRFSSIPA